MGPLAGVLVGVKDNICTADMPSTGGSRILESYRPPFDATAVKRVKELGGIVVGKTNLDEFGMGSTTEGSAYKVELSYRFSRSSFCSNLKPEIVLFPCQQRQSIQSLLLYPVGDSGLVYSGDASVHLIR